VKRKIDAAKWRLAQYLELRWWKKYLTRKDKTAYYAWKKNYWNDFLLQTQEFAPLTPGIKVLDAGCGPAGLFTVLDQQKVVAVDPLLEAYQLHIPHFEPDDFPYVTFIASPLESFNASPDFDQVYCLNVINHVKSPETVVAKLSSALKKGGILVMSVDAHRHSLLEKIFQYLPGDVLHPHQHRLNKYLLMLENEKLSLLHTKLLKREAIFDYWLIIAKKQ